MVQDTRYTWAYLFGAACPARAVAAGLVMPRADTQAMNLHLAEIACAVAPDAHAVVVMDGAGWHTTSALHVPEAITILTLPPYSPELNPAENIWQYLRQNKLANRLYASYEAIVEACCDAWNSFADAPDLIRSITAREWAKVS